MDHNKLLAILFISLFSMITVIASVDMITKANKIQIQVIEKGGTEIYSISDTIYCGDTKFTIE